MNAITDVILGNQEVSLTRVRLEIGLVNKVLVVDDSALIRGLLKEKFDDEESLEPLFASSYTEAEQLVEEHGNTLFAAIVDLILPDSSEGEVVTLVVKHNIPTIVLSGSIDEKLRSRILKKSIVDYFAKDNPENFDQVIALLKNLLISQFKKALIVDTSKFTRAYMRSYLNTLLMSAYEAQNAEEALSLLAKHSKLRVLIIADDLPDMDGCTLIRTIKKRFKRTFYIFGTTTSSEDISRINFLKTGANDTFMKPVIKEDFNTRILNSIIMLEQRTRIEKYVKTVNKYIITSETDANGKITYVSDAFSKISKYDKEELIGKNHRILKDPNVPDEVYKNLWETISAGKTWESELPNLNKNGDRYWVDTHIEPIFNDNDVIVGYNAIRIDVTDKKKLQLQSRILEEFNKKLTDSLLFASLIQQSILPSREQLTEKLSDYFLIWEPKDIVGGDYFYFKEFDDKMLFAVIDCTGHGVPGAFMTMIVKSTLDVIIDAVNINDPATILKMLNIQIKSTLKQYDDSAKSDAGLEGALLVYCPKKSMTVYAGARTPLFVKIADDDVQLIKPDRQPVGYQKSKIDYDYTNHYVPIEKETYFYLTTDGYIDQNGGDDDIPFGKSNFMRIINENYIYPFEMQKLTFLDELSAYQKTQERNDDLALFGIKLMPGDDSKALITIIEEFTQENIVKQWEVFEKNNLDGVNINEGLMAKMGMIYFEFAQNVMKYAARYDQAEFQLIEKHNHYEYISKNIVTSDDKRWSLFESRLAEVNSLSYEEVKKRYREVRKSNEYHHERGTGLGFFEVRKHAKSKIEYKFDIISDNEKLLTMKVVLSRKGNSGES